MTKLAAVLRSLQVLFYFVIDLLLSFRCGNVVVLIADFLQFLGILLATRQFRDLRRKPECRPTSYEALPGDDLLGLAVHEPVYVHNCLAQRSDDVLTVLCDQIIQFHKGSLVDFVL